MFCSRDLRDYEHARRAQDPHHSSVETSHPHLLVYLKVFQDTSFLSSFRIRNRIRIDNSSAEELSIRRTSIFNEVLLSLHAQFRGVIRVF